MGSVPSITWLPLVLLACSSDKGVTVHNTPPSVSIIEPLTESVFEEGEVVEFIAIVDDAQDSSESLEVRWVSDKDGAIDETPADTAGNARTAISTLTPGTHTIVLTVVDSRGESGDDNVQLEILDVEGVPEITIISPTGSETGAEDMPFTFKALVNDREDVRVDLLVRMATTIEADTGDAEDIEVFCAPDPDEEGIAICEYTLDPGEHALVFEVEDTDGNTAMAERNFTVVANDDVDNDFDGFSENDGDCDDADNDVNPDAPEACNGVDDDCDGDIDEDATVDTTTYYADADLDGFGSDDETTDDCSPPSGYVEEDGDCDDADPDVHPDADEQCNGIDDDCDGETDEGGSGGESTWYSDVDGDGYGDGATATVDCAGTTGAVTSAGDCDDTDPEVHPAADEQCNGIDDDCDGSVDEDGAVDALTYYRDLDDDGFGDTVTTWTTCTEPTGGWVSDATDCDDLDDDIHPDADEVCDGDDNDCDGDIDEDDATDTTAWYPDADADTYGVTASLVMRCDAPEGHVSVSGDCDDDDADVFPGATEVCDGVDNNCDGTVDESDATDAEVWYRDGDADTYGDPALSAVACSAPLSYVANNEDCDDTDASIYPGATEVCDGYDDDCDGEVDESGAVGESPWYLDYDLDGYGDAASSVEACDMPDGYVADSSDCDDTDDDAHPSHVEVCDGVDNNCDGEADEDDASGCTVYYRDYDDDGYGTTMSRCSCDPRGHYTADDSTDCYDSSSAAHPGTSVWYTSDRGDGSYDYNCDGTEEKRYTSRAGACLLLTDFCGADNGWSSSTPSCGSSSTWKSGCHLELSGCAWSSSSSRTQSCR